MGNFIPSIFNIEPRNKTADTFVGHRHYGYVGKVYEGTLYYDNTKTKKKAEGIFIYDSEWRGYLLYRGGKTYYPNGNVKTEGTFKDDKLVEGKTYFENGKVHLEVTFKDDEPVEGKMYYEDGELRFIGRVMENHKSCASLYGTIYLFVSVFVIEKNDIDEYGYQFYEKTNDKYIKISNHTSLTYPKILYYKKIMIGEFNAEGKLNGRGKIIIDDKTIGNGIYENGELVKEFKQDNKLEKKSD